MQLLSSFMEGLLFTIWSYYIDFDWVLSLLDAYSIFLEVA